MQYCTSSYLIFTWVSIAAISHITLKQCVTRPTTRRLAAWAHVCVHLRTYVHVCIHDVCICMHKACVYVYNHSHNNHIFFSFYKVPSLITYLPQTNIVLLFTQPILHTYTMGWGVPPPPSHAIAHTIFIHSIRTSPHTRAVAHTFQWSITQDGENSHFCSIHPLQVQLSAYT